MDAPLISYFDNLNTVAGNISVKELTEAIKVGSIHGNDYKSLIKQIRNEQSKDIATKLKKELPKVTISGTFDQRRVTDRLLTHSGLIQIDIDELPQGVTGFEQLRQSLEKDTYSFVCFSSPSDKLKLIVKVPADKDKHLAAFLSLERYYFTKYGLKIDQATKDLARLCFLSHDPNIFVNEAATVYTDLTVVAAASNTVFKKEVARTYPANDKAADVENCIQQIERNGLDITGSHADWVKICFALVDGFGEIGRSYFIRVSAFFTGKVEITPDEQYDYCLHNQPKNSGTNHVKLASFFQACKDYGIDIKSAKKKLQTSPKNDIKNSKNVAVQGTERIEDFEKPINPNCENKDEFLQQNEFHIKGSCYYVAKQALTKTYDGNRISNFIMEFLYFFPDGTNNAKWYIKLQSNTGEAAQVELTAKDLNSISAFKPAIMSKGGFSFSGNQAHLDKIIEYHNKQYQKAHKISCLGWQSEYKIYAYSNGILDDNFTLIPVNQLGIATSPGKSYYLPALSELTKEDTSYYNERKFIYKAGSLSFADYNKYIIQAYGVNGAIGNAYLVAAIFRDIIFAERASFPYLFLFGEAGSGKTTFTNLHLSIFGEPQPGIGISNDSTSKSIARRISQFKNALTYIKEYTNNDVDSSTIGLLKTGYEGVGYDRAQTSNDNKTHQTGVFSGIFIDGNELPEKNDALFSRTITIIFERSEFTAEQQAAKNKLNDEAEKGFGQIFVEVARHRDLMVAAFGDIYRKAVQYLKNDRCKGMALPDRTIEHIALLIAPIRILSPYLKFHISTDEIINVLISAANVQNEAMKESNEINSFFQTIEYLSNNQEIYEGQGRDYRIVMDNTGVEVLSLALNHVYPKYVQQCQKERKQPIYKGSLQAILRNKPYTRKSNQKDGGYSSTDKILGKKVWQFTYSELQIALRRVGH